MNHVVIIGNGIAGITAALKIREQSDCRITIYSKESEYFFSRTALMYVYMGHLKLEHTKPYEDWFWKKNNIELRKEEVRSIDFQENTTIVLATGSMPQLLSYGHIAGIQGFYSLQDLALLEKNTANIQQAVVVGGGLIGIEMAEMLHSRGIAVTMLVREASYWRNVLPQQESEMVGRHIASRGIKLKFNTQLADVVASKEGRVEAVKTEDNETLNCQFVGLTIGVKPNIDFLRNTALETNEGVLVNEYLQTNLPNIYAIGDCAEHRNPAPNRRRIEQIWYTGRMMGETVAKTITGTPTVYDAGIFFNSAKFFDLEYQVYGQIVPNPEPYIATFYWQHPTKEVCLRINYEAQSKAVVGIHALGWRLRQAVCERWIAEGRTLDHVKANIQQASFDPEFSEKYLIL